MIADTGSLISEVDEDSVGLVCNVGLNFRRRLDVSTAMGVPAGLVTDLPSQSDVTHAQDSDTGPSSISHKLAIRKACTRRRDLADNLFVRSLGAAAAEKCELP